MFKERIDMIEQLNQSNENNLFENILDGFVAFDKAWNFIYVNQEAERIFNNSRENMLGKSIWVLNPIAIGSKLYEELHRAMEENTPVSFEHHGLKTGKWYWVRVFPNENGLLAYFLENTEKRNLEHSLRNLADIIEASNDAIISWCTDGFISHWNPAAEKILGYSSHEIIGQPVARLFTASTFSTIKEKIDSINMGQQIKIFEAINLRKDCKPIPVSLSLFPLRDLEGKTRGYSMILRDITERKRSEEALRLSEETFSKAFDAAPYPMTISKVKDATFIKVNKKFLNFFEFQLEEVLGKSVLDLNIWEKPEKREEVLSKIAQQGYCSNEEIDLLTKSKKLKHVLFSSELIDLHGEPCSLTIVNDITELRKLENEVARLDRLNLVGQMAAGIGHEIRNPMTCVRGFLQLLSNKELYKADAEFFNLMIDEIDRANLIITEYLSLARNKVTVKERQNLNHILKRIQPLILSDANCSGVEVIISYNQVPDLIINEKEICQLILNLTRNGLEAMEPGGKIIISTSQDEEEVVLSIKDQGRGIKLEFLEKLGTPFFTTKINGTGLGLAISYSIAHRHNAKINVETGPSGTTFNVRFPLE